MHDPSCVAFVIARPWPEVRRKRFGNDPRRFAVRYSWAKWYKPWQGWMRFWKFGKWEAYWPGFITVWHVEPNGHDSGTVCPYRTHWRHPQHWRIQVHPLQHLRRWALTRCEWCHGRSRKGDPVNRSMQWDNDRGPWWKGERGLFHSGCTSIHEAHLACLCLDGIYESELSGWGYGQCLKCGKRREWRSDERRDLPVDEARRILATIPKGERDPAKTAQVRSLWAASK